jgi:hypothetical protein
VGDVLARFVHSDGQTSPRASGADAEFVVSLHGFPVDNELRARIERAIHRAVLEVLASIDLLDDVSVTSISQFVQTRGLRLPSGIGPTAGLVVVSDAASEPVASSRRAPTGPTIVQGSGSEFRVLLRGLALDEVAKDRIDAAIRSAVLQVVATVDDGRDLQLGPAASDAEVRSIFGGLGRVLGMSLGLVAAA